MTARVLIVGLLVTALVAGVALYWLQTRAFYREVGPDDPGAVRLATAGGGPEPVPVSDFRAIDSDSSPIRYRACFTLDPAPDGAALEPYADPRPLNGPRWFDCYDARAIGEALERGEARAVLGVPDVRYGIDRVVALFPDGRAFAWHQINACGEVVFDGGPPPEGCPPVPQGS